MPVVEVRPFKRVNLESGVVIEGFPSIGLVSTIAATYLISSLKLDQVAAMDSPWFPPVSMIYAEKPKFPARIYASAEIKIAVCVSEFTPSIYLDRFIARSILSWAREQKCSMVITPCGLPILKDGGPKRPEAPMIRGVGATEPSRKTLREAKIHLLEFGAVPGVSGALLNEGRWSNFEVIALLVEAYHEIPDARAAAVAVEAIDKMLPQIEVDVSPLYDEAERIETRLKAIRKQAKPVESPMPLGLYG
jgi:uncharacterized protein